MAYHTRHAATAFALALAASATIATAVEADWVLDGNGSWDDDAHWSSAPAWDGSDVLNLEAATLSEDRTLTLDGDRVIDTLRVYTEAGNSATDHTYTIAPGTGGSLRLNKLIVDRNDNIVFADSYRAYALNLTNIVTEIDDGTPKDRTWEIMPSFGNSYSNVRVDLGEVHSVAGSHLQVDYWARGGGSKNENHPVLAFTKSNPNFLGDITFNAKNGSKTFVVEAGASNALGVDNNIDVAFTTGSNLSFSIAFTAGGNTTHSSNIATANNHILYLAAADNTTATITGNLTGNGRLTVHQNLTGFYSVGTGTVVLAGDANTLSGDVMIGETHRVGNLRVDGTWTGAGNITLGKGSLSGSGSIGMAEDKVFTTALHATQANHPAFIVPGSDGTIGTLSIGTDGNDNSFTLAGNGTNELSLLIDLDGALSDRLVLNGDVTIGALTRLVFNELSPLTAPSYTLLSYSGDRTGTFAEIEGLPEGYSLDYGTPGQIRLVPEPAALSLLSLAALGLRRRR